MKKLTNAGLNRELKEWSQRFLIEGELDRKALDEGIHDLLDIWGQMLIVKKFGEDK